MTLCPGGCRQLFQRDMPQSKRKPQLPLLDQLRSMPRLRTALLRSLSARPPPTRLLLMTAPPPHRRCSLLISNQDLSWVSDVVGNTWKVTRRPPLLLQPIPDPFCTRRKEKTTT